MRRAYQRALRDEARARSFAETFEVEAQPWLRFPDKQRWRTHNRQQRRCDRLWARVKRAACEALTAP